MPFEEVSFDCLGYDDEEDDDDDNEVTQPDAGVRGKTLEASSQVQETVKDKKSIRGFLPGMRLSHGDA